MFPGALFGLSTSCDLHEGKLVAMRSEPPKSFDQLIHFPRGDDAPALFGNKIRPRRRGGSNGGQATGHGFQKNEAETFKEGGEDKHIGGLIALAQLFARARWSMAHTGRQGPEF